jgi:hypothetical protein
VIVPESEFQTVPRGRASTTPENTVSIDQSDMNAEFAPVWIPDNATKLCMVCGTYFNVVRRRVIFSHDEN